MRESKAGQHYADSGHREAPALEPEGIREQTLFAERIA
jgi:hypothetical protein